MHPIDWDDTLCRIPRQSRNPTTTITEPASSGFFVADSLVAVGLKWALAVACFAAMCALVGCGPTEAQAMQTVAADKQDAVQQAREQAAIDKSLRQVNLIAVQLDGERPENITPADWAASQRALAALRGEK